MMSFHVEVPAGCDLLEIHDVVDHIERELKERHHIETVIHVDPVVNDERTLALRDQVTRLTQELDPVLTIHDFRITAGPLHTNLIFDVVVPYGFRLTDQQVLEQLTRSIRSPVRSLLPGDPGGSLLYRSAERPKLRDIYKKFTQEGQNPL